jgi:hypothetical protein
MKFIFAILMTCTFSSCISAQIYTVEVEVHDDYGQTEFFLFELPAGVDVKTFDLYEDLDEIYLSDAQKNQIRQYGGMWEVREQVFPDLPSPLPMLVVLGIGLMLRRDRPIFYYH